MTEILMPRLSDTMEEGVIAAWHKKPGDEVAVGDVLCDIETDKAVMEYEAYEAGTLTEVLVAEGETARIGQPIAVVGGAGDAPAPKAEPKTEDKAEDKAEAAPAAAPAAPAAEEKEPEPAAVAEDGPAAEERPASNGVAGSRPPSSPLARRLARDHGLDLNAITGTGPGGRIIRADIEAAIRNGGAAAPAPGPGPAPA
ncbi:biotin/lipoyl-containing protein, partial [Actinomadura kijaniata]|uniref:biotin/lipoyl-containing protein n=1 Tax=Actinomadura kijaniata TaxID=46161 RepID=UPI0031D29286